MTFSIVAMDRRTGALGVGIASAYPGAGNLCPRVLPRTAAMTVQGLADGIPIVHTRLGLWIGRAINPSDAMERALAGDPGSSARQVAMIASDGAAAVFTGSSCEPWAGQRRSRDFSVQGNLLVGPAVLNEMATAFEESEGLLQQRLLAALEAGHKAGGDKRGQRSAAIVVHDGGRGDRLIAFNAGGTDQPLLEIRSSMRL